MDASLQVGQPNRFGWRGVLTEIGLATPLGALVGLWLAVGVVFCINAYSHAVYSALSICLLATVLGVVVLLAFMPTLNANFFLRRLICKACGPRQPDAVEYDCQITFSPRLHGGLRGFLEDADDVGRLKVTGEGIHFDGDSVQLTLPFESITELTRTSSGGWRALWAMGRRSRIRASDLESFRYIEIGERQSNTFWGSRRISDEIAYAIEYGYALARADQGPAAEEA